MDTQIEIHAEPLNIPRCMEWVMSPESGGINVFIGTVRNATQGKTVLKLEFEAYNVMAISELKKIIKQTFKQWPIQKILVHHRIGVLKVGEIPVVVAVSAAHREAAFDACRYVIDNLKRTVPIWKKEFFEDNEVWVAAHP